VSTPLIDKLTPEMRILVASLLSMAVILLYVRFFGPKPQVNSSQSNQSTRPASARVVTGPLSGLTPGTLISVPIGDSQERSIVVQSALYQVELSNRGAVVRSWQLKKYKDYSKPGKTLDLVHPRSSEQTNGWPFSLVIDDPHLAEAANSGLYKVSSDSSSLRPPVDLTFTWSDGHLEITKKFHFDESYTLNVETTSVYNGERLQTGLAWRGGFGDATMANPTPETVNTYYSENGKLTTYALKKLETPEKWGNSWQGGNAFVGIEDRYFTAAFLPSLGTPSPLETRYWKVFDTTQVGGKDYSVAVPEVAAATTSQPMAMRVYVGPKDYDDLKTMRPPLNPLVQFGWMEFVANPLFHGLKWLHKYIPNWGWAIVALTLAINMMLFPLRVSGYEKTLKMQRVAPEIKAIQERYKKHKSRDHKNAEMNKEVMAVYSREGINPLSGCIPQLLQTPIWFGLYRALQGTTELRQAPWFGWITDLSARDPYYVLPALMGLSMYLNSKITPVMTTDPQQAKMMKIMPIGMAVVFMVVPYPSGLAVYILTGGLVGVLQQWYLNRSYPTPALTEARRAGKS
jgi:YidC/Oxa1 family membrane protein insertase